MCGDNGHERLPELRMATGGQHTTRHQPHKAGRKAARRPIAELEANAYGDPPRERVAARGGAPKRRFAAIAMIAADSHAVGLPIGGAGADPRRALAPWPLAARRLGRLATPGSRI
jgi:hypothetical protein